MTQERPEELDRKVKCAKCGSHRLFHVRIDSDWGDGGDFTRINPNDCYKPTDPENYERIDIDYIVCFACGAIDA